MVVAGYGAEEVRDLFEAWGAEGRQLYLYIELVDTLAFLPRYTDVLHTFSDMSRTTGHRAVVFLPRYTDCTLLCVVDMPPTRLSHIQ